MMKKLIIGLIAACGLLCAVSCGKDDPSNGGGGSSSVISAKDLAGRWELTGASLATKSATIGSVTVSVTIEFLLDGNFRLSQTLGEGHAKSYSGTWALADGVLSGKYSDGKAWGSAYKAELDGTTLKLTTHPDGSDTYSYRKL